MTKSHTTYFDVDKISMRREKHENGTCWTVISFMDEKYNVIHKVTVFAKDKNKYTDIGLKAK